MVNALVADDSNIMRKIIKTNLSKIGVKDVKEAKDGRDALSVLLADSYINLLFLDIDMPEMNGKELLIALKEKKRLASLNIIVISAELNDTLKEYLMGFNIKYFIPKPFDLKAFEEVAVPLVEALKASYMEEEKVDAGEIKKLFKEPPKSSIERDNIVLSFGEKKLKIDIDVALKTGVMTIN